MAICLSHTQCLTAILQNGFIRHTTLAGNYRTQGRQHLLNNDTVVSPYISDKSVVLVWMSLSLHQHRNSTDIWYQFIYCQNTLDTHNIFLLTTEKLKCFWHQVELSLPIFIYWYKYLANINKKHDFNLHKPTLCMWSTNAIIKSWHIQWKYRKDGNRGNSNH